MPISSRVPTPPTLNMQKSATSNHFCRKCLEDSWKVLKKSTPSSGGWASSSRKQAPGEGALAARLVGREAHDARRPRP